MQATTDCGKESCRGTAFWETSCQCYVCSTCGHHNGKTFCSKCNYDIEENQFPLEEED